MRTNSRFLIAAHRETFDALTRQAQTFLEKNDLRCAASACCLAARFASHYPCGFLADGRLDSLIGTIAALISDPRKLQTRAAAPRRIVHILTSTPAVGGHARLAARWMQFDAEHYHDLVVTEPRLGSVPDFLAASVAGSGGRVFSLDDSGPDPLRRALEVRRIVAGARAVVLHLNPNDIVPLLGLAAGVRPPVIYLNHADHLFWVGSTLVDAVADIRDSGATLSASRRMVPVERRARLPIPLDIPEPLATEKKTAIRAKLGVGGDETLLLSVASAYKYSAPRGQHFVDALLPTVLRREKLRILVIGPSRSEGQWSEAYRASGGRIDALGVIPDTTSHLAAADGYVDSLPIGSLTATLEAGARGLPIVSMAPTLGCEPLSCDSPGLDRAVRPGTLTELGAAVERMVVDSDWRRDAGAALRDDVCHHHGRDAWLTQLATVYATASLARSAARPQQRKQPDGAEPFPLDLATLRIDPWTSLRGRWLYRWRMAQSTALWRRRQFFNRAPKE